MNISRFSFCTILLFGAILFGVSACGGGGEGGVAPLITPGTTPKTLRKAEGLDYQINALELSSSAWNGDYHRTAPDGTT
ncbi:MAG: hypothetical protein Q4P30_06020, partial [Eubacteriales bacterium]|nr:hypothetical protein [Eubacteriales bacterium]